MKTFENILLVNDDGFGSEGIVLLKDLLSKYAERIVIVAPDTPQSGKSSSINIVKGFSVTRKGPDMYSLDGTPVDCACFGITSLNIKFDLLVSGCNNGENVGYDTLYSGTIGAGIEGIKNRTKSIAFSTPRNTFENFKNNFDNVFDYILEHDLISNKFLLSVNFPYGSSVKGIKVSKLSYRNDKTFYNNVNEIYYLHREIIDENLIDTDFYYLNHHIVSLTPIKKNLMDDYGFEELNKKTSR